MSRAISITAAAAGPLRRRRHPCLGGGLSAVPGLDRLRSHQQYLAGERHIRAAVGRDYADVPPTRGTFKGGAESELAIAVAVEPTQAPVRHEDFLRVARPMSAPRADALDAGAALPPAATAATVAAPAVAIRLSSRRRRLRGRSATLRHQLFQSPNFLGLITGVLRYQGYSSVPSCGQVRPAVRNQTSVPTAPALAAAAVGAEMTRSTRRRQRRRAVDVVLQIDASMAWMSTPSCSLDARDSSSALSPYCRLTKVTPGRLAGSAPKVAARCNISRAWRRASSSASKCRHRARALRLQRLAKCRDASSDRA